MIFYFGLRGSGLIRVRVIWGKTKPVSTSYKSRIDRGARAGRSLQFIFSTNLDFVFIVLYADRHGEIHHRMPTKRTKRSGSSVTSEQTTKTHEFVTIMNPNEIKDPLKQKLIRQHARRREDSNSTFQKHFKLVFDLRSADTQTAVQRPITGSHSMLSAAGEHLNLTPFVPSIQFLRPLTPFRGLVFTTPHSPEMDIRVVQLVDFSKHRSHPFPSHSLLLLTSTNIQEEKFLLTELKCAQEAIRSSVL